MNGNPTGWCCNSNADCESGTCDQVNNSCSGTISGGTTTVTTPGGIGTIGTVSTGGELNTLGIQ